jgi:hypothetical protein
MFHGFCGQIKHFNELLGHLANYSTSSRVQIRSFIQSQKIYKQKFPGNRGIS